MKIKDFLQISKDISVHEIYQNLAQLKFECQDLEVFKKYIPSLIESTYSFFHSRESNQIIHIKQAYENFKYFVKNTDDEVINSKEFRLLIHQWENAVNFYFLFMPFESLIATNYLQNGILNNNNSSSKWKRILKFRQDVQNRLYPSQSLNKHNFEDLTKKSEGNFHETVARFSIDKQIYTTLSPLNVKMYGLKLLLLQNHGKPETKILLKNEHIQKYSDIFVIETENVYNSPTYTIIHLLIYQNKDAQISTKHLISQRSKISLTRYFCSYNQTKMALQTNQMKQFYLYTNADVDADFYYHFKLCSKNFIFPESLNQKNPFEYVLKFDKTVHQTLKNSIDMDVLVLALLKYTINVKKITLNAPILGLYHMALVNEKIIDKTTSKFHTNFIDGGKFLTTEGKKFRQKFKDALKNELNIEENDAWMFVKSAKFILSNSFGRDQEFFPERMCYSNFKIFDEEIDADCEVDSFCQNLVLKINQLNEDELNKIVEKELGKRSLLYDAEFINQNTFENVQRMLERCQLINSEEEITDVELFRTYIAQRMEKRFSSTYPMRFFTVDFWLHLKTKLTEFFNSDKLILVITASIPCITEMMIKKFTKEIITVTITFLQHGMCDELLLEKHLVVIADDNTKNLKSENIIGLYERLVRRESKTKAIIIAYKENLSEVTETVMKYDKMDTYEDCNSFANWTVESKKQFKKQTVNFQNKKIAIDDLIRRSQKLVTDDSSKDEQRGDLNCRGNKSENRFDELITADLVEKLCNGQEIKIGKYSNFCQQFSGIPHELWQENGYISRKIWRENGYNNEYINETDLLGHKEKSVVIVGSLGLGKTTLLANLLETMLSKGDKEVNQKQLPWIVTIDLKNYSNLLNNFQSYDGDEIYFNKTDGHNPDFGEVLLRSFLVEPLESEIISEEKLNFEQKLFQHYVYEEKLCIFIDGFGEISTSSNEKLLKLFTKLGNETDNHLIITTPPEFQHLLENYLVSDAFILKPFSKEENKKFVKKYREKMRNISPFSSPLKASLFFKKRVLELHSPLWAWINQLKLFTSDINSSMDNKSLFATENALLSAEKIYEIIAIQQMLRDSLPEFEMLLNKIKENLQIAETKISENIEDYVFLREINSNFYFINSFFAEYFGTNFLKENLFTRDLSQV